MDIITLDLETYYAPKYSLTGLTIPEYVFHSDFLIQGVGIQINDGDPEYFPEHEVEAAIEELDLENSLFVGQNLKFDASILAWKFGRFAAHYVDTMDLARAYWPGQDASLEIICQRLWPDDPTMHKGEELASFKGIRELDDEQQAVMGNYCKQDVRLTYAIYRELIDRIPPPEIALAEQFLRMYIDPPFRLDDERVARFLAAEKQRMAKVIKASGLPKTRLSSNKQFAKWIREQGMEVPQKESPTTGKMTDALGQKDPAFLKLMADNPEHKAVWEARAEAKSTINQSRSQSLLTMHELLGKIAVPLSFYGAHTGRPTGTQKINMLNLPRGGELRRSLYAPEGYVVHVADSAQIEARTLAELAGQTDLVEKFRRKEDAYSDMATKIYGYQVDRKLELPDGTMPFKEEGNVGKTARLGLQYGMGAPKFRHTLASGPMGAPPILVSEQFAQRAVDVYRNDSPMILNYWGILGRAAYDMMLPKVDYWIGPIRIRHQQIDMPNGMALKYPNLRVIDETDRDGNPTGRTQLVCDRRGGKTQKLYGGILAENVTQALSWIIVIEQARLFFAEFPECRLALALYDEIVAIGPDDGRAAERQRCLEDIMRIAPKWLPNVPLDSEGGYDYNYSK